MVYLFQTRISTHVNTMSPPHEDTAGRPPPLTLLGSVPGQRSIQQMLPSPSTSPPTSSRCSDSMGPPGQGSLWAPRPHTHPHPLTLRISITGSRSPDPVSFIDEHPNLTVLESHGLPLRSPGTVPWFSRDRGDHTLGRHVALPCAAARIRIPPPRLPERSAGPSEAWRGAGILKALISST